MPTPGGFSQRGGEDREDLEGARAPGSVRRGGRGAEPSPWLTDQVAEPRRLLAVKVEAAEGAGPVLVRPQAHGAPEARGPAAGSARRTAAAKGQTPAAAPPRGSLGGARQPRSSTGQAGISAPPARVAPEPRGFLFRKDRATP